MYEYNIVFVPQWSTYELLHFLIWGACETNRTCRWEKKRNEISMRILEYAPHWRNMGRGGAVRLTY